MALDNPIIRDFFDSEFSEHRNMLVGIARKFVPHDQAEDTVQDALVKFISISPSMLEVRHIISYLVRTLKSVAIDRRRQPQQAFNDALKRIDSEDLPTRSFIQSELQFDVEAALSFLDDKCRIVVEHRLSGLTFDEIALVLSIHEKTARNRFQKALEELRFQLDPWSR